MSFGNQSFHMYNYYSDDDEVHGEFTELSKNWTERGFLFPRKQASSETFGEKTNKPIDQNYRKD